MPASIAYACPVLAAGPVALASCAVVAPFVSVYSEVYVVTDSASVAYVTVECVIAVLALRFSPSAKTVVVKSVPARSYER